MPAILQFNFLSPPLFNLHFHCGNFVIGVFDAFVNECGVSDRSILCALCTTVALILRLSDLSVVSPFSCARECPDKETWHEVSRAHIQIISASIFLTLSVVRTSKGPIKVSKF